MEITFSEEEVRAWRRFLSIKRLEGVAFTNAVYIPPAAQLRNRANEIEQDERDAPILREILKRLNEITL